MVIVFVGLVSKLLDWILKVRMDIVVDSHGPAYLFLHGWYYGFALPIVLCAACLYMIKLKRPHVVDYLLVLNRVVMLATVFACVLAWLAELSPTLGLNGIKR